MRKFFVFFILCLIAPSLFAIEIFVHKTNEKKGAMCQAVRIKDNWFMTAAHCVLPYCENSPCEAEIPLGKTTKENISWPDKAKTSRTYYDIALINFKDVKGLPAFTEPSVLIIKESDISTPQSLNRNLVINFYLGGQGGQIQSAGQLFYGPKNKIIFTREFGLFHGISGAGVLTNKNELISLVSGVAGQGSRGEFSVFPVFDEYVKGFLESKNLFLNYTYLNKKDFSEVPDQYKEKVYSLDNN